MHPRRTIRDAIADRIRTGNTGAATRVWASREAPVKVETVLMEQGPVVLVYTRKDVAKSDDYPVAGNRGGVRRTLEVIVEVTAVGADIVDDKLDALTEEIEALLENFDIPGLPATELRLESAEIETTDQFEQPLGVALMAYEALYWKDYRAGDNSAPGTDSDYDDLLGPDWEVCGTTVNASANGTDPETVGVCDDCEEETP